jgi:uncharacterized protein YoxC
MTSFITAVALFLAALGFLLFTVFLNRMTRPLQRLISEYCERKAHRALPEMVRHLLENGSRSDNDK